MGADDEAVEQSLISGMRSIAADDVDDGFRKANSWSAEFALPGFLEIGAIKGTRERLEERSRIGNKVESFFVSHDESEWSMLREHPRGRAPGSRPMRVKDRSSCPMAKSCVRMAATL